MRAVAQALDRGHGAGASHTQRSRVDRARRPDAGEDAEAAMDAIWAFRERLLDVLQRPVDTRRNAP